MLLICNNWTLSHIINDGYYLNITVEACRFHFMLKYLSFVMIRVLITFCTVNTLQICWFIREFEHLKVSFVCGCLNDVHIPHQQYFTTPSLRATFPPSGNLFYFCLPFHFTVFYLFIFLFRLLSSSCCALLGRSGRCLGRGDDRTPSIMQNVSTVTAWQPWRAAIASSVGGVRDTKTTQRQEVELKHKIEHTLSFNGIYSNFNHVANKDKCDKFYISDSSKLPFI